MTTKEKENVISDDKAPAAGRSDAAGKGKSGVCRCKAARRWFIWASLYGFLAACLLATVRFFARALLEFAFATGREAGITDEEILAPKRQVTRLPLNQNQVSITRNFQVPATDSPMRLPSAGRSKGV